MTRIYDNSVRIAAASLIVGAVWQFAGAASPAWADEPAAAAAPAEEEKPSAMSSPSMTGPLVANPKPMSFELGPIGQIYTTGAITTMGFVQSNHFAGDHDYRFDGNGHLIFQKTDGIAQFYAQFGAYSFPALGAPYFTTNRTTGDSFGFFPVGYAKIAPTDEFSIQFGKLPTLIGAEYAFTFQNMNVHRGLLWNQEPIVSRGIQGNYTLGPLAFSVSLNDGFYSSNYNWISGSATYTINKENTLALVAGGNFGTTTKIGFATPLAQNNSRVFNIIYTYNSAPWTITPYFQYTNVPSNTKIGIVSDASTYGGALLVNYAFNDNFSLAGRGEVIGASGSAAAPNLLYGPGSNAFSFTLTPTYQEGIFFIRGEGSFVQANSTTAGFAFGRTGGATSQARLVIEAGVIF